MPPRKRTVAEAASTPVSNSTGGSSRRRSNRISLSGKKSTYFEDGGDDELDEELPPRKAAKTQVKARKSRREESLDELQYTDEEEDGSAGDGDDGFVEKEESDDDDGSESEEVQPVVKKRGRGRPSKGQAGATPVKKINGKSRASDTPKAKPKVKTMAKAKSRSGEDEDDDDEDNRITFIPAIQLRGTDGVDYEDTRIHRNTLLFLKDLRANNERAWLKENDGEYRRSLKDWESFVETLTEKIIEVDDTIPELPLKDVIFRIYRDIRFSKDPTPYKPHYSAAWSRTGRKGPYACYYVHAEPGRCMVGGGLWHPDNDALARLRASIDERPHRIRRVLMNPTFRKTFLPHARANEKSVLSAFAAANQENALKTKPKGFNPEHRDIELLKLRNYTIGKKLDDKDLLAEDAQDRIMSVISAMVEFVTFINSVVMPDPNIDSDSDEADGGEEGQEGDSGGDDGSDGV
ncbi:hypothetical protein F5Y05DRAFT_272995 [Hypoxylon sp. FL0543]|nr:hypothetical protein F5Y05DRAFT_272995 [Hypoxylon sp. FL0543]